MQDGMEAPNWKLNGGAIAYGPTLDGPGGRVGIAACGWMFIGYGSNPAAYAPQSTIAELLASTPEGRAKMREALGAHGECPAGPLRDQRSEADVIMIDDMRKERAEMEGTYKRVTAKFMAEADDLRKQLREASLRIVELQEQLEQARTGRAHAVAECHHLADMAAIATGHMKAPDTTRDAPMQPASAELVRKVVDEALAKAGCVSRVRMVRDTPERDSEDRLCRMLAFNTSGMAYVLVDGLSDMYKSAENLADDMLRYERRKQIVGVGAPKSDAELVFGMLGVP